ncbi:MAG TPA: DUF748 domain-containing protein [Steroidobacteraceae bacterium]|nr:DUF748 domain-containing protein [Steroidobacteraceae bacterium]
MTGVRVRRYLVILTILALLVGLYAAAGFLLVPRWIRSELTGLTARDFGRTLSLGEVRFNPFTWKLEVRDFSLPDADGRPMIAFGRLEVALGISSVPRLAPSVSRIVLDSPHVSAVVRRDGMLNLADLEKPFAQPARGQAPPANAKPFRLFIDRLAIEDGSATYEDDSRSAPFRLDLDPIAFELLDFSTAGSKPGSYHLAATIGQGGRLDWTGTVRAEPISLHGTLELDGLSARTVAAYLGPVVPAEVSRGTIALRGGFAIDREMQGTSTRVGMTVDVPQAQVSGLGVRPRQAASDYVELGRFTLDQTHIDLEQHSIRIGAITLADADVRGWLDRNGQLNLLELLGHAARNPAANAAGGAQTAATASAPPHDHSPVWRIAAPDIRIEDTRASLEDRAVKPAARLVLGPLSARITGYDSSPQSRIRVALRSAINGTGRLALTGDGSLQPEAMSAKLQLSRVDLRALQPYLDKYTALTMVSGFLNGTLDIDRRADGRLGAAGRLDVADLRTVDDDLKLDFVKWKSLRVAGLRYVSSPASLHIDRIVAAAPYARVVIGPDRILNVSEALHPRGWHPKPPAAKRAPAKPAPAEAKALPGPAHPSMPLTIGLVRVANGTADYADYSIQPNFATGIQDLHGAIKGLSSDPSSRATVDLRGKVDRYAPVDIAGVVNLLSASTYSDVRMKFRGLELTRMTPYAVRFAGYRIASGTLDADLHYEVQHGTLNADHRFVIDQLQLGEQVASPHATKLPLRLAVALLKDRDGVIRLGLPVTGSLNDPHFSLGPLIGKALLNVLKKAVTAPFAMLGRLFGGGPDLDRIDFAPGSATLLPAAQGRVKALAKALAQRPQLRLEVPAVYAPDVDGPALAHRRLRDELLALARSGAAGRKAARPPRQPATPTAGAEVLELPAEHFRLLRAAYRNEFGPKAPLPAAARKVPPFEPAIHEMQSELLKRMRISDADLQALGQRRAQAIHAAILAAGGVEPGRVGVTAAAAQRGESGRVAVKLGLK